MTQVSRRKPGRHKSWVCRLLWSRAAGSGGLTSWATLHHIAGRWWLPAGNQSEVGSCRGTDGLEVMGGGPSFDRAWGGPAGTS
jgi:hypothetical protein